MKKKLLYIGVLIASLGLSSCDDILDTKNLSTDNLDYLCSNPTDARKMINHVYAFMCEDTYTSRMSTNWMQNTDVEVGYIDKSQSTSSDRRGIWCLNPSYFSDILNCWDNTYKAIDFANQCIQGIEASDMYKEGHKDMMQLHGEAYCLRAYWYWLMCNFWGDVPFSKTPTTKDDMHNDPRTDKNIIYSSCIQDLINVEGEMKKASEVSVEYMNHDFALGFITKLAMFRAGYSMQADGTMKRSSETSEEYQVKYIDKNGNEAVASSADDYYHVAIAYGEKLINEGTHHLGDNFKEMFDNEINDCNPGNGDVLYEVGFVPNSGGDIGWCHGLSAEGSKGSGKTYTNLTGYYACSFDKEDQRLPVTCASYTWLSDNKQAVADGFNIQPAKWCRMDLNVTNVQSKGTGINWPVLRYADVILLVAEAYNEIGDLENAKKYVKMVRDRAFIKSPNKSEKVEAYLAAITTKDEMRKAIINERAWELGGENIRKFDLVRWNYFSDAIVNTIQWTIEAAMNYQKLEIVNGEFVYNKDKEVVDMGVAPKLYYYYKNGKVEFENDYLTYRDEDADPTYKAAETLKSDDIKAPGLTFDGLKYVSLINSYISVSANDANNKPYGTDENGDAIKKGTCEKICYSWFGLTDGVLINGTEYKSLDQLRTKPTPYVFPIPTDRITSSNGILSNDGYAIRNK